MRPCGLRCRFLFCQLVSESDSKRCDSRQAPSLWKNYSQDNQTLLGILPYLLQDCHFPTPPFFLSSSVSPSYFHFFSAYLNLLLKKRFTLSPRDHPPVHRNTISQLQLWTRTKPVSSWALADIGQAMQHLHSTVHRAQCCEFLSELTLQGSISTTLMDCLTLFLSPIYLSTDKCVTWHQCQQSSGMSSN